MVVDRTAMIAADYWAVWWRPRVGVTVADLDAVLEEHLAWMLGLEREGHVLASGPITSGPGASAGSGLTVLRAGSSDDAARLAAQDPFVLKGLRTFEIFGWRLMEGALTVRLSFGTATYKIT